MICGIIWKFCQWCYIALETTPKNLFPREKPNLTLRNKCTSYLEKLGSPQEFFDRSTLSSASSFGSTSPLDHHLPELSMHRVYAACWHAWRCTNEVFWRQEHFAREQLEKPPHLTRLSRTPRPSSGRAWNMRVRTINRYISWTKVQKSRKFFSFSFTKKNNFASQLMLKCYCRF